MHTTDRPIIVMKYTSNRKLERGLTEMARKGYQVQSQATRRNLLVGIGQTHVVTFCKNATIG